MTIPIQDAIMIFKTELEVRSKGYYDYLANGGQSDCAEEAGIDALQLAIKALEIADRLEQADVINNEEIQIKACERYGCLEKECPIRARDKFCYDLAGIFFDGYNQALADIRGDAE